MVLGHDHCGAVDAAMNHEPDGYIKFITDEISKAIGDERDEVRACCLNIKHSCDIIERSLQIQKDEKEYGLLMAYANQMCTPAIIDTLQSLGNNKNE